MQVICDDRGFVQSFAFVGNLVNGIEVADPETLDLFTQQHFAFRLENGKLVHDATEYENRKTEEQKEEYRRRRETECFSVINRGQLWYEGVSLSQLLELRSWYKAWLNVTETMVVPEKPTWIT